MNYQQEYEKKLISPEEAAGLVENGMNIQLGGAANTALIIDKYLAMRKDELENVKVGTFIDLANYEILKADPSGEVFEWWSGFLYRPVRSRSKEFGPCVFRPNLYHDVPRIVREYVNLYEPIDIAYIVTTSMDKHGYFNFGLTCSHIKAITEVAEKVVVVVKENMPWINGGYDECIHISEVDYIVEDRELPVPFIPFTPPPSREDEMIAENIINAELKNGRKLIQNGSTIQVGIGGLPDTVVKLLKECGYRNLGVHTEMIGDGTLELIEEGIVTNSEKRLDRGKSVFTFALGSLKLYDYLDKNPEVATYPVDYTNDPFIIAQQPKMFSLNQAAEADLMGQINSEQMGLISPTGKLYQVSGTGGQLDFVMGCLFSRDRQGISVLAMYSTHNGTSRIKPILPAGAAITVPRSMVQVVATEWGVAYLRGLTVKDRAIAMIHLAHPDYRDWLANEAEKIGIFPPNYTIPAGKPDYVLYKRD
ncbi:acetyl-CoA hydrolase/transferase family protein [Archaeoglobus neptunius]|uniref:acetyl-CoA hydrolase/transferase family protein n=1 Tax=Archaeoglobus neptunius TaxID=2798580 RepID=UPI0019270CF0|nr:acetyl-CoA hydrolase/transferase family protein [Archaeoglobus neptunius]